MYHRLAPLPVGTRPNQRRWWAATVVAVAALSIIAASCGSDDSEAADVSTDEPAQVEGDETAETDEAAQAAESDDAESADASSDDSGDADEPNAPDEDSVDLTSELFPDVIDAVATHDGDGSWTFAATLSSPYDSPQRYADAWRVVGADGEVYGTRELTHDHASEQPFTRSHSGIQIPEDVTTVTVEGRDQVSGWGGATIEVELVR